MKQKIFTLLFAIVASAVTMSAENIEHVQIGDLYYYLNADDKTAEVAHKPHEIAFKYSGDIVIPSSVEYETVTYRVTSIAMYAFSDCINLTSVTIPNSITNIGTGAFSGCAALTSLTIPNSVTLIGKYPFAGCPSLMSLIVETGNTVYDSRNNCNAVIETASNKLIAGCTNTIIPNNVTTIGENAFNGCTGLISIAIPNSVTSFADFAFSGCPDLTSLTIPNSVTSIGYRVFAECSSLASIEIPNSITNIGGSAFSGCTGLSAVTCLAVIPPTIMSSVFYGVDCSNIPLYVPVQSVESYKVADVWKEFNPIVGIDVQAIDQVSQQSKVNQKLIKDGQIFILRDDKTYTLTGQEVK